MHEWLLKSLPEALTRTISRTPCYSLIPPYQGNPIWVIRVKSVGDLCGRTAEGERMTVAQNLLLLHFSQPFTQPAPYPNTRTHSSFFFLHCPPFIHHIHPPPLFPLLHCSFFFLLSLSESIRRQWRGEMQTRGKMEGRSGEESESERRGGGRRGGGGGGGGWKWSTNWLHQHNCAAEPGPFWLEPWKFSEVARTLFDWSGLFFWTERLRHMTRLVSYSAGLKLSLVLSFPTPCGSTQLHHYVDTGFQWTELRGGCFWKGNTFLPSLRGQAVRRYHEVNRCLRTQMWAERQRRKGVSGGGGSATCVWCRLEAWQNGLLPCQAWPCQAQAETEEGLDLAMLLLLLLLAVLKSCTFAAHTDTLGSPAWMCARVHARSAASKCVSECFPGCSGSY